MFTLKPVWAIDPLKRRSRQAGSKNCDGRPGRARKAKTGTRELPCHRRVTPCRDTTERDDISRIRNTQNQSDSSRYHKPYRYQTLSIPVSAPPNWFHIIPPLELPKSVTETLNGSGLHTRNSDTDYLRVADDPLGVFRRSALSLCPWTRT